MINSNSASASEILAGAIQDNDRGTIVGRRSFGKGLVQEDLPLRDGSNLRLTVARYYTPTGRCIQRSYEKGFDEYYEEKMAEYDNGELFKPDTNKVDSLRYRTPKGKIVYGGGGISPDVFIPFDSSGMSWYYTELRYSQAFNAFAFDFLQGKRSTWKSLDDFERKFVVSDALLQRFVQFSEKELKIKPDQGAIKRGKGLIVQTMKAEIARQIWLEDGYYRIMNATDKEVQRALRSLR
jgi:carboxyl-terminal processing protease